MVVAAVVTGVATVTVSVAVTVSGTVLTGKRSTGARKSVEAELLVGIGGSDIEVTTTADLGLIFLGLGSVGGGAIAVSACITTSTGFTEVETPLESATSCALWSGVMSRPLASRIVAKSWSLVDIS
jgi:hypothetical protein